MNILLVYPEMPDTIGKFQKMVELTGKKSSFPPVGLLTVASLLPPEWNKKVVDLNVTLLREDDVHWADYVFISAMNVQSKSVYEVIEFCNRLDAKIVAGGPLFTHEYELFEGVDHFVLNEAEITLPQFLADLSIGEAKHVYTTNEFADTHQTPPPMWDLINLDDYLYAIVQYSRGCPYLCDFCDVTTLFGRKPRTKTPEQIIAELELIINSGNNDMIFFADDNLIGNKRELKNQLLPALIEWRNKNPFAPGFSTQLTINLADDKELAEMLIEAGFRHILIGIETVEEASLIAMKKKQNAGRNLLENIRFLQEMGFMIFGTFIVGLDTDTENVFDSLSEFIQESGIVLLIVNVIKAPPGTELHERMKRENRLLDHFEFGEDRTNILPVMPADVLHNGYKKVLKEVYSPPDVYKRIMKYYSVKKKYRAKNPLRRKIRFKDLRSFLRILLELGIKNNERKYFWKLILFTLKNNYNNMDITLLFAVMMYHYNIILKRFYERETRGEYIYSAPQLELN
ncbi:MAG: B12-binding domain-containing radical SAM protein [Melioribacteraceae bacterium]|nr:B12-binding domain-containing radical SAM protein [Melioribacteraceae bacterium]MCF8356397.1 B12-binding domain-containing radical SAM protein [Melioribacteraceae bacterium]MCF8392257.1 B12-binding domain-containing radical SAM protein [Melioribacteraceae bacterium]MCF8417589.1 B12-binding domain-containing radical SAM protein [Melioribacteraceae bacterium]